MTEPGIRPFLAEKLIDLLNRVSLLTISPQDLQLMTVIGTPQLRWRDRHQSGRPSIIE